MVVFPEPECPTNANIDFFGNGKAQILNRKFIQITETYVLKSNN